MERKYGSQGGYIYISYDDPWLFSDMGEYNQIYAVAGARKPLSYKCYYCDEYGAVSSLKAEGAERAVIANVYEFGAGEKLMELSFTTWSEGAEYALFYAPVSDGIPVADEAQWKQLAEGTVDYSGYMTVPLNENEDAAILPEGKGAIILALSGSNPEFGTDESILRYNRPFFNAKIDKDTSFLLKDGSFTEAKREVKTEDREYTLDLNFSLRAYTKPVQ